MRPLKTQSGKLLVVDVERFSIKTPAFLKIQLGK